jgi:hypothetical protein
VGVGSMVVSSTGVLYLIDAFDAQRFLVYRPNSDKVRTLGRHGRGPGQFRRISGVGFVGDTIWASDTETRRTTFFTPEGQLLRIESNLTYLITDSIQQIPINAVIGDGTYIAQTWAPQGSGKSWRTLWLHVAPEGEDPPYRARVLDTLGDIPMADPARSWGDLPIRRRGMHFEQPFSDHRLFALSPDGRLGVTVSRDVTDEKKPSYVIEGRKVNGKRFRIRVPYTPQAIVPRDIERAWGKVTRMLAREGFFPHDSTPFKAFEQAVYRPAHVPPVRSVLVGVDHTIWVQREDADVSSRWDVFDGTGKQLGYTDIPDGAVVKAVTREGAWAVENYIDEIEQVVRYRITRK